MAYEVVVGRNQSDREKLGLKGCVLLGKHYVKMGQTSSLSNEVWMDVSRSHVVFLCGKRGSGKSYTMGAMAEGIANLPPDVSKNIAVLIMDTMGIYWTMKYPNQRDRGLLDAWNLSPQGLDVKIFSPHGVYDRLVNDGIPIDAPFSLSPSELEPAQWPEVFQLRSTDPVGALIEETFGTLKESGEDFSLDAAKEAIRDSDSSKEVKHAAENLVSAAERWGLFSEKATPLRDIIKPGQVSVLDVSAYASSGGSWDVRALVIGMISQKLFEDRMLARRAEEHGALEAELAYQPESESGEPVVWILIDEAHEFLPRTGSTPATKALVTLLREGRQPGVSLVLATQQPGKIHTDVMTQSDIVISHRITAKVDTDALGMLTQSYMRGALDVLLNELPRVKGAAIVLDDNNEKLYSIRVRPRFTWHGGSDPNALHNADDI